MASNFAPEAVSFPTLPPIDLRTRLNLNVELRPKRLLQKHRNGSNLPALSSQATAELDDNLVERSLSYAIFGKVHKPRQSWSTDAKRRHSAVTVFDDPAGPTFKIVDCRSIVPTWAFIAQTGKVT